jgi:nitroimidazol reductase NimA-like FMN-containing flavoprotein (pyridoxamine 5'-phosphate oxidase superfamily)
MSEADEYRELPRRQRLELLASRSVGRVALSQHALPTVVPVTYRLLGDRLVFTAPPASRILGEGERPVVAFEVDDIDPDTFAGWSVVVVGVAREIAADPPGLTAGMATDHISGRWFSGTGGSARRDAR